MIDPIQISFVSAAVIIGYLLLLIGVGLYYSRFQSKSNPADELFLSGRSLPWYKIGLSIFSTNVSPSVLVGTCGIAYTTGMVVANFDWQAWWFLLLLSAVFIPRYLKNKISTMPEFLMKRFGAPSHAFMSYYTMFSTLVVWVSFILFIGGVVLEQITGISFLLSTIVIVFLSVSYSLRGGLRAIVHTGVLQSVIVVGVTLIMVILGLNQVGGVDELISRTPKEFWSIFRPSSDDVYPWHAIVLGYPVIGIWYWCTDQTIVQRVLAAKDIEQGQTGAWFVAFLKILMPFLFLIPGIICFVLYPKLPSSDYAYVTMITRTLPAPLTGLALGALIASLINDIAMGLNAFGNVFATDVYAKKINKQASPEKVSSIGQKLIIVGAVSAVFISFLISLTGKGLFELGQSLGLFMAPPLSTVFLLGALWKKSSPRAAEVTLYVGMLLCIGIGICYLSDYPYKGFWPHFMLLAFYMMVGLMALMISVSFISPARNSESEDTSFVNNIDDAHSNFSLRSKILWIILAGTMAALYWIFR